MGAWIRARPQAARTAYEARSRPEQVTLLWLAALLTLGILLRVGLMYTVRPALLGYTDTATYVNAAMRLGAGEWFASGHQPNGYPMFMHLANLLSPKLPVLMLIQHALGVASALLLYATVRRAGGPPWLGLFPAGVVLLAGFQLFAEHAPITEPLFTFLVSVAIYAAVRAMDRPTPWWPALVGLCVGAAPTVRTMGLTLVPILALWFLFERGLPWRARGLRVGAYTATAALVLGAYVIGQEAETGYTGLTRTGIWNLYGRAAPFADCDKFTPPEGTEVLCEDIPEESRTYPFGYVYDINLSPGLKIFAQRSSPSEQGAKEVGAFARAAILGQPLDYLRNVADDAVRFAAQEHVAGGGPNFEAFSTELTRATNPDAGLGPARSTDFTPYYPNPGLLQREGLLDHYRNWDRATRIEGLAFIVAFALMLAAPFAAPRGRTRRVASLLVLVTLVLMVTPLATLYYNARFTIPVFGPLVAASALGGWALLMRWRARSVTAASAAGEA